MVLLPHLFYRQLVIGWVWSPDRDQVCFALLLLGHCLSVLLCIVIPTLNWLQQEYKTSKKYPAFLTSHKSPILHHANLIPKCESGA